MTRQTARTLEIASAVLSSNVPDSVLAAQYGVTAARVSAIRRAAGLPRKAGRRRSDAITHSSTRGRALLAQLVADAAAAAVAPEEYLRDAAEQAGACERIVRLLADAHDDGKLSERESAVWRVAIGKVDQEIVDKLRRVLAAAADSNRT